MITFLNLGKHGRLGNQMFQIASTIGIATKHGYSYGFPEWINYDGEKHGEKHNKDYYSYFKNPLPKLEDIAFKSVVVDWGYNGRMVFDNSSLLGYMQSPKYFAHCENLVRHYFTFKKKMKKMPNTIAVHFRGGDYGSEYHPLMTKEYYTEAMKYMPKGCRVVLFTDDEERASGVIPFKYVLAPVKHPIDAMQMMSMCEHHIIANSSFSWWGAWLANSKRVVAPKKWFGEKANKDFKDGYYKEWIIV